MDQDRRPDPRSPRRILHTNYRLRTLARFEPDESKLAQQLPPDLVGELRIELMAPPPHRLAWGLRGHVEPQHLAVGQHGGWVQGDAEPTLQASGDGVQIPNEV